MSEQPQKPKLPTPEDENSSPPPQDESSEEFVSSVRDVIPGWWQMMLDEKEEAASQKESDQTIQDNLRVEDEAPEVPGMPKDFELLPEQEESSLWELAPNFRPLVDETPVVSETPPDLSLLPPLLPFVETEPPIEVPLPAEFELVPPILAEPIESEPEPESVWEVAPSWWRVYSEEAPENTYEETDFLDDERFQKQGESLWAETVSDMSQVSLPEEEPASVWDYAPSLQDHLSTEEELAAEQHLEETTEPYSSYRSEVVDRNESFQPQWIDHADGFSSFSRDPNTVEEGQADKFDQDNQGDSSAFTHGQEVEYPEVTFSSPSESHQPFEEEQSIPDESISLPLPETQPSQDSDSDEMVNSVWETVPSWWKVYSEPSEAKEPRQEEHTSNQDFFTVESFPSEEQAYDDLYKPVTMSEIAPELSGYIEQTLGSDSDESPVDTLNEAPNEPITESEFFEPAPLEPDLFFGDIGASIDSELDMPADLVAALEQKAADLEAASAPKRSPMPIIIAVSVTVIGIFAIIWFGGRSLMSGIREMQAAARVIPTPMPTPTPIYPNTQTDFPMIEKSEIANPVAVEVIPGVIFTLQEGQIVSGMWKPEAPEWLPGSEFPRIIAIPWVDEYIPLIDSLATGAVLQLAMSNMNVEQYRITKVELLSRDQTASLNENKLSMVIIFNRPDEQKRWIIFCDRIQ